MNLHLDDLTVDTSTIVLSDIIECWLWLVKDCRQLLLVSKMGDLFYESSNGCVYWLATDTGTTTQIANDTEQFNLLLHHEDNIDNWFLPLLIEQLIAKEILLKEDQVYSYKQFPILGGEYDIDNIEPTNVSVHFGLTGQVFEQVSKLPEGTRVKIKITD